MGKCLLTCVVVLNFSSLAFGQYITDLPDPSSISNVSASAPAPSSLPIKSAVTSNDSVLINSISRESHGKWYRVFVNDSVLDRIEIEITSVSAKVYDGSLITESGERLSIREFKNSQVLKAGTKLSSENLNVNEPIVAIDLLLESFGGSASARISALSNSKQVHLNLKKEIAAPQSNSTPPVSQGSRQESRRNSVSLAGRCADPDHSNFYAIKEFAYSPSGLNYPSAVAAKWALEYNRTHACNTISEYAARFKVLFDTAYNTTGLNYDVVAAQSFAFKVVEIANLDRVKSFQRNVIQVKRFAYAIDGLNLSDADATRFTLRWIEGDCEADAKFEALQKRFTKEKSFAYSVEGLDMNSYDATRYAKTKIAPLTSCKHLMR